MRTDLEKLLKLDKKLIKKKLEEFEKFYHDKQPFETLTALQQAKVLMEFVVPPSREELVEIIESCGCLPKNIHTYSLSSLDMNLLLERGIGQCTLFSILYKIIAQHKGMHDEEQGRKCVIALSDRSDHILIHFYVPWRGKKILHIIDPTNGTFDRKPGKEWATKYEPATEVNDKIAVDTLRNAASTDNKATLAWYEANEKLLKNNALFWLNKGKRLHNFERYDEAMECFEIALNMKPTFLAKVLCGKGEVLSERGDYEGAFVLFEKAALERTDIFEPMLGLCLVLRRRGYPADAIEGYDQLLEEELTPIQKISTLNGKGAAFLELGDYPAALDCFDEGLKIAPNSMGVLSNKGLALAGLGRFADALDFYDRALSLEPDDEISWFNKGKTLSDIGKFDEAVQCFDKVLKTKPKFGKVLLAKGSALSQKGEALVEEGEALVKKGGKSVDSGEELIREGNSYLTDALVVLIDAVDAMPENEDVWLRSSVAFSYKRDNEKAFGTAMKALDLMINKDSRDEIKWFELTTVLCKIGAFKQALKTTKRMIQIMEKSDSKLLPAAIEMKNEILGELVND